MKHPHPFASALLILGLTLIGLMAVFFVGILAMLAIYGDSDEASWGFTLIFCLLIVPLGLLTRIIIAVNKFLKERRRAMELQGFRGQ